MLELGSSVPWKEAMERVTGATTGMDTSAFRTYFKPLEDWLTAVNDKNGVKVGWKLAHEDYGKFCKAAAETAAREDEEPEIVCEKSTTITERNAVVLNDINGRV